MSSTEIVLSPTKKAAKDQIVSSDGVTNGCDVLDNVECSNGDNDDESALITSLSETNKDCHEDAGMEPLLIQDFVDEFSANQIINETNNVLSDDSHGENEAQDEGVGGGGGFIKSNLSLNLNELMKDDKDMPKNKKFLESSDDQIINQIFFSTITVTPTTDDDVLDSKFLSNDNTPLTPNEVDPELLEGPVDFFNRKIDEDEAFDTTFTDATENYQENDGNLCSLNDNFNENYCSFSSIDYNPAGPQQQQQHDDEPPGNELLQPESFLGNYGELMRQQRPSIVIDCYDSDSNSEKNSQTDDDANIVVGEEKVNDYCFYFDQTIEEDDDDACYLNRGDNSDEIHSLEDKIMTNENDKEPDEVDECFETEEEIFNDEEALPNELDDDKSLASDDDDDDDEGVINESCISVNVSRCS